VELGCEVGQACASRLAARQRRVELLEQGAQVARALEGAQDAQAVLVQLDEVVVLGVVGQHPLKEGDGFEFRLSAPRALRLEDLQWETLRVRLAFRMEGYEVHVESIRLLTAADGSPGG